MNERIHQRRTLRRGGDADAAADEEPPVVEPAVDDVEMEEEPLDEPAQAAAGAAVNQRPDPREWSAEQVVANASRLLLGGLDEEW